MNYILSFLFIFFCWISIFSQTEKEAFNALMNVNNAMDVQRLEKKYPKWTIGEFHILEIDTASNAKIIEADSGEIVPKEYINKGVTTKGLIKVLGRKEVEVCKVQYIFLSMASHTQSQIDSLQALIINKYKDGTPFIDLVKEFNEDGNPTGDLDWFRSGMMVSEFDQAVRPINKGELLAIDIPTRKWAYVVLKLEDNKMTDELSLVRIMYH